jgi:hypothetical protein
MYGGPRYGYQTAGWIDHANVRFVNVSEMGGNEGGTDYRLRLYYDNLDTKNYPQVLDDLAAGILGSLMVWPDRPEIVAHSLALEKFFAFLDKKLKVRLGTAGDIPESRQMAEAHRIVKESLAPLVDSISVDSGEYKVRFKLSSGGRGPWVTVPVVYGLGNDVPSQRRYNQPNYNEGFSSQGKFERAGPFYYDGPDSGASMEPAQLSYNPANLYWKD